MNNFKIAIAGVVTFLGILGGVWAMEEHYVPRDYHLLCMDQVQQQVKDFQKTNQIQRAQDQVFFWMRIEVQLVEDLAKNPGNFSIQRKLDKVVKQRLNAEANLESLMSK